MSGHSKWANIKRKKGKSDAERGKIFTKLGREIAIAVKQGGPDPNVNSKLSDVIAKAKAANMPNDTIMRSIKRASGDTEAENYEEITYEGYGPGGVAVIVETATDNRNRTAGDLRHYFDKFGGNLGQTGCVSFLFNKKGVILIEKTEKTDEDTLMMEALDAGAEDFSVEDEYYEILTDPNDFSAVREALEKKGYEFMDASVQMVPVTTTKLEDPKQIEFMDKLIEALEDLDDVQNVWHNWEQDEE
ncbi:YebC/PmpR family DNA-binding transcriptional regulator [Clostridium thermosuccinogenes]|jgi:YebC/PmpR family DNA-binding regulatory protein|uniref:Probable transcriptional regulatory protein CDQ84_10780 n=1 Tax=Clostridium thermosuccinogenes TaxID=84032 RepID=A0A2K2FIK2_9CLOT|nr:YebC/PmpR family DNA-binding transcriptional regulator [Pseudoclostridium thermosuccinogenes]AUS95219.1 YebC/PmpR family DNA-binding transcriptional regulator [Pseudoclostridium thermosuccinogenes]PNT91597.1 YebC/PmpR family DNA-binding transcriptional regulator [Pseudoclostridium thermosuccinogenes]PNT96777.1 YebC/PmpR family DNA-binding transcriptional regulator [Pseudoclostridium thermosuccinogenes]PNT98614.1 YebC/PmpR family DNA-binding transcriptional regulator [Pseudoclostridium thermo